MTTLVINNVTGAGQSGFGLTIGAKNMFGQVITPGFYTTMVGPPNHRRVHHAAWMAIGFSGGGIGPDYITFGIWIAYEAHYLNVDPEFLGYGDTFFYETTPGCYCSFEVDY